MLNKVILMGRLTSSPELKTTTSNVSVTSFAVALDRKYQKQGEEKQTDFINCVAWRNTAEFISKFFSKGEMIAIVGSIQTNNYTDKDGSKRTSVEVVVDEASFCGSKRQSVAPQAETQGFTADDIDDDLPF